MTASCLLLYRFHVSFLFMLRIYIRNPYTKTDQIRSLISVIRLKNGSSTTS